MKRSDAETPAFTDVMRILAPVEAEARGLAYGAMVFTVESGGSTPPHAHASEETWLVREGEGRAAIGDRSVGLRPGTRLSVPPGALHSITNTSAAELVVMAFWWRETSRDE
jgi:quercetin dioxygenase-like cupin family protein